MEYRVVPGAPDIEAIGNTHNADVEVVAYTIFVRGSLMHLEV